MSVPTAEAIAKGLDLLTGHHDSVLDVDEQQTGGDTVEFYGRAEDGTPIGVRVQVVAVWETDP